MTHLPDVWQVDWLILWYFFHGKIHFFSFFNTLRYGLGDLQTQYPNFKLWDLPAIPFAKCG